MPYSILDIMKILPQTNCSECGFARCMTFAVAVIKNGEPLEKCPYLPKEAGHIAQELHKQQKTGKGSSREALDDSRATLQKRLAPVDLKAVAKGLGARYCEEGGSACLELEYFGNPVKIFKDHIAYPAGMDVDPWDDILLYNYVCSGGNTPATGRWISFKELAGIVSHAPGLNLSAFNIIACDEKTASALNENFGRIGAQPVMIETSADLALFFKPLSMTPMLLLYYSGDPEEGTTAQMQFLFDECVAAYLDFEGAFFLIERTKRILTGQ